MTYSFRTIGLPSHLLRVVSGSFGLKNYQTSSDTILTRQVRVGGLIEQRWGCSLELVTMERETWQEWDSFRARLSGQVVLFTVPAPAHELDQQYLLGEGAGYDPDNAPFLITGTTISGVSLITGSTTCQVKTAAARWAQWIHMKGLKASSIVFKHGDLFGLGGNLYMAVAKVTSDASGEARVPFRFKLWKGAAVGDVINLMLPTCRMQLRGPDEGIPELMPPELARAGFSAIEVPYL